jgi:hypothetical protein
VIAVADGMNLEWAVCFVSYLLGGLLPFFWSNY